MAIALYTIRTVAFIITQPISLIGIAVFAFVFYKQNLRTTVMQKMIVGESLNSPAELTISQLVIGIIAGVVGSVILSYLGVMFDEHSAIGVIFLISLLLMLFNPKYICFSYSGAILGLASLILSEIASANKGVILNIGGNNYNIGNMDFLKIDILALMTLVGVLHIIEGILVAIDGKRGAIPVFTSKDSKIIGGFALKRYWILPVALMIISTTGSHAGGATVSTPNWWPIITPTIADVNLKHVVISMLPLFGCIGYNSVTFTKSKEEKTIISGGMIFTYAVLLKLKSHHK